MWDKTSCTLHQPSDLMLLMQPMLEAEHAFFPLHPFTLFENGRQVYASPTAEQVRLSCEEIDHLPTVAAEGKRYAVLCHGADTFPTLLVQALASALQGKEDTVIFPFFYLYNAYCRSLCSELVSNLHAEPSTLPASYAVKHSAAYFMAHTLTLLHGIGVCGMKPLSIRQHLIQERIAVTVLWETRGQPLPSAEEHPLRVLARAILAHTDLQESSSQNGSRLMYVLSAPHYPFKEELATPYHLLFRYGLSPCTEEDFAMACTLKAERKMVSQTKFIRSK